MTHACFCPKVSYEWPLDPIFDRALGAVLTPLSQARPGDVVGLCFEAMRVAGVVLESPCFLVAQAGCDMPRDISPAQLLDRIAAEEDGETRYRSIAELIARASHLCTAALENCLDLHWEQSSFAGGFDPRRITLLQGAILITATEGNAGDLDPGALSEITQVFLRPEPSAHAGIARAPEIAAIEAFLRAHLEAESGLQPEDEMVPLRQAATQK